MNAIALLLFTMFYAPPAPPVPFYAPPALIQAPQAAVTPVVEQAPIRVPKTAPAAPTQPEHGQANPADFYGYTCPAGQYPIGDGQCHVNNDRPGEVVK
jgi:hypothetical protein